MKFVPHNYQRYCINRMITDPVLGLFLDMGLGKTVITLTAVNDLRFNRFAVRKVLVIAPKKVAEENLRSRFLEVSNSGSERSTHPATSGCYQETMSRGWLIITKMTGRLTW